MMGGFPVFQRPVGTPEQTSPYNNFISNAMKSYQHGVRTKYAPEMMEADIFNKQLGPLATLATSPMFLNNPQFQHALGGLISENLHKFGHGFHGAGQEDNKVHFNSFSDNAKREVEHAVRNANKVSDAGKVATGVSGLAGKAESLFGHYGKDFVNWASGGKISSELAKSQNEITDSLNHLKQMAVQTQQMSPRDAEETFSIHENETSKQALDRVKKTNPELFQQQDNYTGDSQDERALDNEILNHAAELSQEIKQRTGKDIPETVIFDYIKKHPGQKIHLPTLLRGAM